MSSRRRHIRVSSRLTPPRHPVGVGAIDTAGDISIAGFAHRRHHRSSAKMLRQLAIAALATTAAAWWKDEDTKSRGEAPYPYPATHPDGTAPKYDTPNEVDGPMEGKINVHLVPHTHDDTGWLVTVDQYFFNEVRQSMAAWRGFELPCTREFGWAHNCGQAEGGFAAPRHDN